MGKLKKIPANSNGAVLSPLELILTLAAVALAVWVALPAWYWHAVKIGTPEHFRLAYTSRDDYELYSRIVGKLCEKHDVLFLGDSVVWGMYVGNDHTLPAFLNRELGRDTVANIAIDGLHPVAMETLVRHYGGAIRGKRVCLYWNPLWMNTPLYDLTGEGDFSINHPRLLPQFDRSIRSYHPGVRDRCQATLERLVPFYGWLHHLRVACFDNGDFKKHLVRHPAENPLAKLHGELSPVETGHGDGRFDWKQSGIKAQDWPWVDLAVSRQWRAYLAAARRLRDQGNEVVAVIGTINPHMQTPASLARYRALRAAAAAELRRQGYRIVDLPELPSQEYADASHPLAGGYRRLAKFMAEDFRKVPVTK